MKTKFHIDEDTGVEYADCGRWRSYQLYASGNTLEEMYEEASISEVDQDGGDLANYALEDASKEVQEAADKMIEAEIEKAKASGVCRACGAKNFPQSNDCTQDCTGEQEAEYDRAMGNDNSSGQSQTEIYLNLK